MKLLLFSIYLVFYLFSYFVRHFPHFFFFRWIFCLFQIWPIFGNLFSSYFSYFHWLFEVIFVPSSSIAVFFNYFLLIYEFSLFVYRLWRSLDPKKIKNFCVFRMPTPNHAKGQTVQIVQYADNQPTTSLKRIHDVNAFIDNLSILSNRSAPLFFFIFFHLLLYRCAAKGRPNSKQNISIIGVILRRVGTNNCHYSFFLIELQPE